MYHLQGEESMKRRIVQKLLLITTAHVAGLHASAAPIELRTVPFVQWRSQSRNVPRKLVGTTSHHVYLHDMESFYGTFNITPQYDQTFNGDDIAEVFFGSSLTGAPATNNCNSGSNNGCNNNALVISGSLVPNRAPFEWMAENFYLPRDFKSTITFSPKLRDFLVDFYLYVGLDEWVKGMYFRIYGPVVNNKATLEPCETIDQAGTIGYAPGFFSPNEVPTDILLPSALAFFSGRTTVIVPGITVDPLLKSKITDCKESITGFADLRGEFGWNYLHEDYHVGFNIQAAAPTGSRPHGEFLFEPYVGNGKHWELGLGLSAHWTMWRSQDDEQHLDFVFEADVTHLFNASQQRVFDLVGKPNSRYMLAEKMNLKPTQHLFGNTEPDRDGTGTVTQASSQFNNEYSPVANFSTRHVNVSVGVQGDIVAMLNYTYHGFSFDLGYNYWGMSHEDIDLTDCDNTPAFPENTWALKGDAQTFGFAMVGSEAKAIPLSGTEMGGTSTSGLGATIHQGTNIPATNITDAITNPAVDNAQFAQTGNGGPLGNSNIDAGMIGGPQIQTSIQPVFISITDLNIEGAETRGSSNKIFSHFSYTWIDREDWIPYLGIGFDAEFGNVGGRDNSDSCDNGISAALSEWAVFIKGGVSFD
jgi:hypothetical protein